MLLSYDEENFKELKQKNTELEAKIETLTKEEENIHNEMQVNSKCLICNGTKYFEYCNCKSFLFIYALVNSFQ